MPQKDRVKYNKYKREYMRKHREMLREIIEAAKAQPCADCQIEYPSYVMQFDHVRGEKMFHVSQSTTAYRTCRVVEAEIAKCEVVCANCHAERTHKRRKESIV